MSIKVGEVKLSHVERLIKLIESHPGELFNYLEILTALKIPSGSFLAVSRDGINSGRVARIRHLGDWVYGSPSDIKKAEKVLKQ